MTVEYDEAYVKSEVDHARRKARAVIAEHLFSYAADAKEDLRTSGETLPEHGGLTEDMREGMRAITSAIDLLRAELEAWVREGK
jgi:hypothetical protein